jgi:hypothetical protein
MPSTATESRKGRGRSIDYRRNLFVSISATLPSGQHVAGCRRKTAQSYSDGG